MNLTMLMASFLIMTPVPSGRVETIKGQLLVQFRAPHRYGITVDRSRTGLVAVDSLGRQFGVVNVEKVIKDPRLGSEREDFGLDRLYLISFPTDLNSDEVAAAYRRLPDVDDAWPNRAFPVLGMPNDPMIGWHIDKCQLPAAWDVSHGDSTIVVCCVDNGVDWKHEDLEKNLWVNAAEDINHNGRFDDSPAGSGGDRNYIDDDRNGKIDDVIGWNFKAKNPNPKPTIIFPPFASHGTSTTGVAAAVTNDSIGIASPGWNCRAMAVNCDYNNISVDGALAIEAIHYAAANGARVISMSFGGYGINPFKAALAYAQSKGCLSFGAAGNDDYGSPLYPAADSNALAVAASNLTDHKAGFSNYGTWVELCAPGDSIIATTINDHYDYVDGTSFACPLAAGIAALVWAAHPRWTNDQVRDAILSSCDSMPDGLYRQKKLGKGRINAARAIAVVYAAPEGSRFEPGTIAVRIGPNPFRGSALISCEVPSPSRVTVKVFDSAGRTVVTLFEGWRSPGRFTATWNGRDAHNRPAPAGVYFCGLDGDGTSVFAKAVLVP